MTENNEQKKMAVLSGPRRSPAAMSERRTVADGKDAAVSLRDYLSIFFKHKRVILIAFMAIIVASSIYPLLIYKAKYQTKSILLIKFGWENLTPDFMPEKRRLPSMNQAEVLQSEVNILRSRELKERVVNTLKPEKIFPELTGKPYSGLTNTEAAIFLIERNLSITPEKGNTLMVTFAGDEPDRACALVNQIVDTYIDRRNEVYKDPKSLLFLEKKADEYAQKLADAESRMKAFQAETNIVSFDEQRALLLKQQYELGLALSNAEDQKKGCLEKITEIEKLMASIPKYSQTSEIALSYRVQPTEQKILDLQLLERELAAKYKDDNKLLIGARERLQIGKDFIENQRKIKPAEVVDPVWKDLRGRQYIAKAELVSLDAQIESLGRSLKDLNGELKTFETLEQKNKTLVNEIADNDKKYRDYRQKVEEAKVFDDLNRQKMTSVSVIERALPSNFPTNPFRPLIVFIPVVLAAAVFGSLALAYLLEMLGNGLSTPAEAEKRLELPVLISIEAK